MRLPVIISAALLLGISGISLSAYGQGVTITNGDTVESTSGKTLRTDELYFDAIKARLHEDNKQAKELLEKFVAERTDVAAAYYELARIYNDEKNYDKATEYIKRAESITPGNKWYKEAHANVLAAQGEYLQAATMFGELAKSEPLDPGYPLMAAEYYERAQKYDFALVFLDLALQRNGDDEDILMHKVQIYLTQGNADKAASIIQQLISKDPDNGKYYKLLGELYDNSKMIDKATTVYEDALKKLPNDAAVQLGLAEHYLKMGDTTSYKSYLKKAITNSDIEVDDQLKLLSAYVQTIASDTIAAREAMPIIKSIVAQHPNDADVLAYYGEILENNDKKDSAAAAYKRSVEVKPSNFTVWGRLLGCYLERQYADSLIKYSAKAMKLFPNQAIVHFYNGVGHMNKKNYPVAIKAFNRAIDMQPDSDKEALGLMYSTLGDAYNSTKDYTHSDEAFDKALKIDPKNETVLNNYSYYLSERGVKLDEAETMSKKSLEVRPNEPTYLDTYGWILYKKGDYEKARTYVQKAIDLSGTKADGPLYDHLGDIYYKLNNRSKALDSWKTAKEKGSENPQIDKKISEGKLYE